LGWGGFAAFFSYPPLIALTIMVFALAEAALFSAGNLTSGERKDCSSHSVLAVFDVISDARISALPIAASALAPYPVMAELANLR
jgi:hypothetical protein